MVGVLGGLCVSVCVSGVRVFVFVRFVYSVSGECVVFIMCVCVYMCVRVRVCVREGGLVFVCV